MSDPAVARMHLGAALHVIEDYSHSNYIEVALNLSLEGIEKLKRSAPRGMAKAFGMLSVSLQKRPDGTYVDTLYDRKVSNRQAVTTGTFGGTDTYVSIAHVLLPKLHKVRDALMKAVDRMFTLAPRAGGSWDRLKDSLKKDRPALALAVVLEATEAAGITVPMPANFKVVTNSGVPSVDPVYEQMSVRRAIVSIDELRTTLRGVLDIAKLNPALRLADWIFGVVDNVMKAVEEKILDVIKGQINSAIFGLLGAVTGLDAHDLEKKGLDEAIRLANQKVEAMEAATSIEVRLKSGDLKNMAKDELELLIGPVTGRRGSWKAKDPLPPSHSEIGKDHRPHAGHDALPKSEGKVKHEDGSIFFWLHRQLALSADRAILSQMQAVWGDRIPMLGKNNPYQSVNSGLEAKTLESLPQRAAEAAKEEGRRHAQTDPANAALVKNKELVKLLDLADIFIAHPADLKLPVMTEYFKNPFGLKAHVEARNGTRGARK